MSKQTEMGPKSALRTANRERGFSMLELAFVVMMILIVSAMAYFQFQPALQSARSDAAMREVLDQLRQAREYSIVNRRYVQVTFPSSSSGLPEVQLTEMNSLTTTETAGSNVVLSTVTLESPVVYTVISTMPDTPDGYGKAHAIEFEGANGVPTAGMLFQSDGELVDGASYQPINGTVFLGVAGNAVSARAVSVMGATGRVRGWRSNGNTWTEF
jgi:prepilin-type N-terminal cleavage/methylation domain-containing protein